VKVPRDYQKEALCGVLQALAVHESTLLCLPTGTGKTFTVALIASQWVGRVFVCVHLDEQVAQWEAAFKEFGMSTGVEKAERAVNEDSLYRPQAVIGSVQTCYRQKRIAKFDPDHFTLLVFDEGHHGTAASWKQVKEYFRNNKEVKTLYVTATPKRGDGVALSSVCDSVGYHYELPQAIVDGYLVPVQSKVVNVLDIDLSNVSNSGADLNQTELENVMNASGPVLSVVMPVLEVAGDRQAIVYASGVKHAANMANVFNSKKPCSAVHINGTTPSEERRDLVDRYKAGEIQFLCVFGLFLEAFDSPTTSIIVMARPTKNASLYEQMLGRGTRPLPGVIDGLLTSEERCDAIAGSLKPAMLVIDYAGNCGKHNLIRATDLLGGRYGHKVKQYAKQLAESEGGEADVSELMERALIEQALHEEESERLRQLNVKVDYRLREVDPFGGAASRANANSLYKPKLPPTAKQVSRLVMLGVSEDFARSTHRTQANQIIRSLLKRKHGRP
jgi:superfamily II DNA or RNA helicase